MVIFQLPFFKFIDCNLHFVFSYNTTAYLESNEFLKILLKKIYELKKKYKFHVLMIFDCRFKSKAFFNYMLYYDNRVVLST